MSGAPDEHPSVAEFGQWRAKMAQRGIPQWWIDLVLGTNRNKPRAVHDFNVRQGYLNNQIDQTVFVVTRHLEDEGWTVELDANNMPRVRTASGDLFDMLETYLKGCDFSALPVPLANDVRDAMQSIGYCP